MVTSETTSSAYLPERIEAAKPGSRLGALYARWRHQLEYVGEAVGRLRLLEGRRAACDALIRGATPESDFVAVAAAQAEVAVLDRSIEQARAEYLRRDEPAAFTRGEMDRLFGEYRRLKRYWLREFYLEDPAEDRHRPPEELARHIADLVGSADA